MKKAGLVILFLLLICGQVGASSNYYELGERILKKGLEGVDVAILQQRLCLLGLYDSDDVDGIYGPKTVEAVKELQRRCEIKADGVVGPATIECLPLDMPVSSRADYNREDILILARVIHGEARGELFKGQVGVGAVILNRIKHPSFPNTIREVVMEDGQFSCLFDGQINYYPTEQSLDAARAALAGYDPTRGALFFYNPAIATNVAWISQRPVAERIGNHLFLY